MFIQPYQPNNINKFHAIAEYPDGYGGTYMHQVREGGYKTKQGAIKSLKGKVGHVVELTGGKNVTIAIKTQEGLIEL
jgi:hypothetical protein